MRGSPLIRFICLTLALVATGFGLLRVTAVQTHPQAINSGIVQPQRVAVIPKIPFRLQLSVPATTVTIDTGKLSHPLREGSLLSGSLELDPQNPRIGLVIRWQNPPAPGEYHFAKLTLEAPGQATLTHVFDAQGDIDDFLELPIPATQ